MRGSDMRGEDYTRGNLDEKADQWLRNIRDQVAPRPHLALEGRRAALLVIDMLEYFAAGNGRCFISASAAIVPRIQSLIRAFRDLERPVIYTRHGHAGALDLGMLGRFFSDYIRRGEPESEIIPSLVPQNGDPVIHKTTYDAFLGTELDEVLSRTGSEQVVISGVLTHMCCETTARAAFCRGFEVYLPVDAMASSRESLHVGSLTSMADAVGIPMRVQEVLAKCNERI